MTGWSFLLSRRWAGYLALTVVFAIVCCALGTWQLNRRAEAQAEVARIDANYDAAPVPLARALPALDAFDEDQRWLPVELRGEYLADEEVLIRNRPYGGTPGLEVVTPFLLEDGTVFMVNRGWIPGSAGDAASAPPPPAGEQVLAARLKGGEVSIEGRTASGNLLATIDLGELAGRVDAPSYTGAYGLLVADTAADELPRPSTRPIRDEGPHLSYALQWFVFALLAFIGLGWAARQERRALADPVGARAPHRGKRAGNDADVEDGILDAHL